MSADKEEPFLSRWSRRKLEGEKPAVGAKPVAVTAAPATGSPPLELPALDSLQGVASEYKEFLRPEVDESLRRAALKRLFSDPRFNAMDGLDVYIDDYSKPDPIPEAMMRTLEHARDLLADKEQQETPEKQEPSSDDAAAVASETAAPRIETEKDALPSTASSASSSPSSSPNDQT